MKNILLYLLIVSYSILIIRPALPTIADTAAHIFWYSKHMATVHYENGQYHVHMEYAAAAKKGYPEKNILLKEESVSLHLLALQVYDFANCTSAKKEFNLSSILFPANYGSGYYIPPRAV